jgi:hypothetical protein
MHTQYNIPSNSSVKSWVPQRRNILKFKNYWDILHNTEAIGRIAKWACELGAHDIEF